ncbi:hypothetical protein [Sphingomonas abietis]|uniref:HD domain-containing protein n=1 Tax=Sphingomonas abietis TaxID=3012344 RepID=A0ABY7NS95_9SPHN|nr:hypothetical protein [Sphingomonas abietis]WBO22829.1 hypothetical protein PBT88_01360 [Sphingomonas abietis]
MTRFLRFAFTLLLAAGAGHATPPDPQQRMAAIARSSPLVRDAIGRVRASAENVRDPALRRATIAALFDPDDCIRHRIGMDATREHGIIDSLRAHGWIDASLSDAAASQGLFPPLRDAGTPCPRLPSPDLLAAGGDGVSHHSWPGGLALHVAFNIASARAQIGLYARQSHATGIDEDQIVTAALWHDWAKALTLQWRADGMLTPEIPVAGTGAHHILGLAEAMRRGFPPSQVMVQACAHGVDPALLAAWLGAAALVASVDARLYPVTITPECLIHHLSDQNWIFADAAIAGADRALAADAGRYGFGAATAADYRLCYRHVALAYLGADRMFSATPAERDRLLRKMFRTHPPCGRADRE